MVNKTLPWAAAPATVEAYAGSPVARYSAPRMRFDGTTVPAGRGCAFTTKELAVTAVISNVQGDPLWSPPV